MKAAPPVDLAARFGVQLAEFRRCYAAEVDDAQQFERDLYYLTALAHEAGAAGPLRSLQQAAEVGFLSATAPLLNLARRADVVLADCKYTPWRVAQINGGDKPFAVIGKDGAHDHIVAGYIDSAAHARLLATAPDLLRETLYLRGKTL